MSKAWILTRYVTTSVVLSSLAFVSCQPKATTPQPTQGSETVFGRVEQPVPTGPSATNSDNPLPALEGKKGIAPMPSYPSVAGRLVGTIYFLEPEKFSEVVFEGYAPVGQVSTNKLEIPNRSFQEGFPGISGRFEWFGLDYRGVCRFTAGKHGFRLSSDDGSRLYVDDQLLIKNDGTHPEQSVAGALALSAGLHRVRVTYFQGPATEIALSFFVTAPGQSERIFVCQP